MTARPHRGPNAERRVNMSVRDPSRASRVKRFLSVRSGLVLCWTLLVVTVLAHQLYQSQSDRRLDTRGKSLPDVILHLQECGMRLTVVPTAKHGTLSESEGVYLTQDASATWAAMQQKKRVVECIHEWRGTVWLGRDHSYLDAESELTQWGEHGCRIGDFLLFGDKRLLDRIRAACR
jgi:hypothetical protein